MIGGVSDTAVVKHQQWDVSGKWWQPHVGHVSLAGCNTPYAPPAVRVVGQAVPGYLCCCRNVDFINWSRALISQRWHWRHHLLTIINRALLTHKLVLLLCSHGTIKRSIHLGVPSALGLTMSIIPMKKFLRFKVIIASQTRLFGRTALRATDLLYCACLLNTCSSVSRRTTNTPFLHMKGSRLPSAYLITPPPFLKLTRQPTLTSWFTERMG